MISPPVPEPVRSPGTAAPAARSLLAPSELPLILLGQPRLVLGLPLALFALGLAVLTFGAPRYRAESRMHPSSSDGGAGRFAGIAAQFGVSLPGGGAGSDPVKLYIEMLGSQQILREALTTSYAVPRAPAARDSIRGKLIDLLKVTGRGETDRLQNGVNELKDLLEVTPNDGAGTIRLRVTTQWPLVSEAVNRRLLDLLNLATVDMRRTQAGGERQFVEGRLAGAQGELLDAEDAVQRFLEKNRRFENSQELSAELERLRRRVQLRQQVYIALAQAYEQARIDEVRNTPVLAILDPPELTATKLGRKRDALIWFVVGLVLAVGIAVGREAMRRQRAQDPAYWAALRATLRDGLRALLFRPPLGGTL